MSPENARCSRVPLPDSDALTPSDVLLNERDGAVAILRLNRPHVLNALSSELCRALHRAIVQLGADNTVRAIVVTGTGNRAFTAGTDLKEAAECAGQVRGIEENPVAAIEGCRTPIIAAVNGLCITGGMEIMVACDVVYAASTARFADTHVRVGLLPGWGLSVRMARQIGAQRAKEISLSGNFIDARRAFDIGLVNRVLEPELLLPAALELAHDIASADPHVVAAYKNLIDQGLQLSLPDALRIEQERSADHLAHLTLADITSARHAATARNRTQAKRLRTPSRDDNANPG